MVPVFAKFITLWGKETVSQPTRGLQLGKWGSWCGRGLYIDRTAAAGRPGWDECDGQSHAAAEGAQVRSRRKKFLVRVGGQSRVGRTRVTFARVAPLGGYDRIFVKDVLLRGPKCAMLKGLLENDADPIFWLLVWFD